MSTYRFKTEELAREAIDAAVAGDVSLMTADCHIGKPVFLYPIRVVSTFYEGMGSSCEYALYLSKYKCVYRATWYQAALVQESTSLKVNVEYDTSVGKLVVEETNDFYYSFLLDGVYIGNQQDISRCQTYGLLATIEGDLENGYYDLNNLYYETKSVLVLLKQIQAA